MARTPTLEKPASLRILGLGLVLIICFFLWLTWAFFSKTFTDFDNVTLISDKSGLSLNKQGDVKLRGMIVGEIRNITTDDDGKVVITMGMDPQLIDRVPRDVRAEIIPKTLFGEKYISLIPTGNGSGQSLKAGDTITDAVVPVEFEKFFNDIYPILTAVPPEKIAYTLTALANSLEGRGENLGKTLEISNEYLEKLNPETQAAVSDIIRLGQVSQTYASRMDEFGRLLRNSSKISRTVVDKQSELSDLFRDTDRLADVLNTFFDKTGDDLIATVNNSVQPLKISAEYSVVFPCWFKGLDYFLRNNMDSILKNGTLHIDLIMQPTQATYYDPAVERPIVPTQRVLDGITQTKPNIRGYVPGPEGYPRGLGTICDELSRAAAGNPLRSSTNPLPIPPQFWKLLGIRNSHNGKLGTDADYNRPITAGIDIDSSAQTRVLKNMTSAMTGVTTKDVPDVASLLISPIVRGAGVSVK